MTKENLDKAIFEAKRFLEKAIDVQRAYKLDAMIFYGSKVTGAVKRSSMDLSRALTEIRK
jgi:hypothetical protein